MATRERRVIGGAADHRMREIEAAIERQRQSPDEALRSCPYPPGSPEKIAILTLREERGEELFGPDGEMPLREMQPYHRPCSRLILPLSIPSGDDHHLSQRERD